MLRLHVVIFIEFVAARLRRVDQGFLELFKKKGETCHKIYLLVNNISIVPSVVYSLTTETGFYSIKRCLESSID